MVHSKTTSNEGHNEYKRLDRGLQRFKKKHLEKFGEKHKDALKEIHKIADNRYNSMEFSEADKFVSDFEKIIKQHFGADN